MAMRIDDLLDLLGLPAEHPGIASVLADFGIDDGPALPDEPPDEQSWFDWLVNGLRGIEFGFQDQADFLAQDPQLRGRGPLLLTQICFYCQHPGVQPYDGPLPLGLLPTDGRSDVRRKLLTTDVSPRAYARDVWDLPKFRLIVAYAEGDREIASVLCVLPIRPWPRDTDEITRLPSVDQLIALLGEPADSPRLLATLAPLRLETFGFDPAEDDDLDLRHAYGLDLSFIESTAEEDTAEEAQGVSVLGSMTLYRDRDLDAYGWKGDLPRGIRFDDSQTVLFSKIGQQPAERDDDDLEGFAVWHLPEFTLHVLYSNVHNYLLRVTLLAPGLWDSAKDEE